MRDFGWPDHLGMTGKLRPARADLYERDDLQDPILVVGLLGRRDGFGKFGGDFTGLVDIFWCDHGI